MEGLKHIDDGGSWKRLLEATRAATKDETELEAFLTRKVVEELVKSRSFSRRKAAAGFGGGGVNQNRKTKKLVDIKRFYEPERKQIAQKMKKRSKRNKDFKSVIRYQMKMDLRPPVLDLISFKKQTLEIIREI